MTGRRDDEGLDLPPGQLRAVVVIVALVGALLLALAVLWALGWIA